MPPRPSSYLTTRRRSYLRARLALSHGDALPPSRYCTPIQDVSAAASSAPCAFAFALRHARSTSSFNATGSRSCACERATARARVRWPKGRRAHWFVSASERAVRCVCVIKSGVADICVREGESVGGWGEGEGWEGRGAREEVAGTLFRRIPGGWGWDEVATSNDYGALQHIRSCRTSWYGSSDCGTL
eukprot:3994914-Pleurochrysis_carterae.AAC.1